MVRGTTSLSHPRAVCEERRLPVDQDLSLSTRTGKLEQDSGIWFLIFSNHRLGVLEFLVPTRKAYVHHFVMIISPIQKNIRIFLGPPPAPPIPPRGYYKWRYDKTN